MNRSVIQFSVVFLVLAACVSVTQAQTFEWELVEGSDDWMAAATATVAPETNGLLDITAELGGISVEGGDVEEVQIQVLFSVPDRYDEDEVRAWMERLNPEIEISGERIEVHVDDFGRRRGPRNYHLEIEVIVPMEFNVDAHTCLGGLSVSNLNGAIDFETDTGGIDVEHVTGDINLSTDTGHIDLIDVEGSVWGHTDTGSLELNGVRGTERCRITTGTGSIDIMDTEGYVIVESGTGSIDIEGDHERLKATTGTGSVEIRVESGEIESSTGTGRMRLTLDGDAQVSDMDLYTGSGCIDVRIDPSLSLVVDAIIYDDDDDNEIFSDFTMEVIRERHDVHSRITLNDGGPVIAVVTEDGDISIEER